MTLEEIQKTAQETQKTVQDLVIAQAIMSTTLDNAVKEIATQGQQVQAVNELALVMRDLTNEQKNSCQKIEKLSADVDEIKNKPNKRWEVIIASIVTGVVGYIVAHFFK